MNKKLILAIFAFIVIAAIAAVLYFKDFKRSVKNENNFKIIQIKNINMKILSPAFEHNSSIPAKYTCDGDNINPALQISEVPETSKSLVLIVDDPDATRGYAWLHWTVWNIAPETKEIAENSAPTNAVEGKTDFGTVGYGGPCPPSKTHRYFFKLFALDIVLNLPAGASLQDLEKAMEGHILAQSELMGLYNRE